MRNLLLANFFELVVNTSLEEYLQCVEKIHAEIVWSKKNYLDKIEESLPTIS